VASRRETASPAVESSWSVEPWFRLAQVPRRASVWPSVSRRIAGLIRPTRAGTERDGGVGLGREAADRPLARLRLMARQGSWPANEAPHLRSMEPVTRFRCRWVGWHAAHSGRRSWEQSPVTFFPPCKRRGTAMAVGRADFPSRQQPRVRGLPYHRKASAGTRGLRSRDFVQRQLEPAGSDNTAISKGSRGIRGARAWSVAELSWVDQDCRALPCRLPSALEPTLRTGTSLLSETGPRFAARREGEGLPYWRPDRTLAVFDLSNLPHRTEGFGNE
jgi:hypothetical protein